MKIGAKHSEETKAKIRLKAKGRIGDKNSFFGKRHSEETKAKLRAIALGRHMGNLYAFKGDKAKPETGRVRAEKLYPCPKGMGRHHIDGNPLNNAPENILIVTPKQHRDIHGAPWKGKHHSEETKEKMSIRAKLRTGSRNPFFGKHHSEETKAKISKANKGKKHFGEHP